MTTQTTTDTITYPTTEISLAKLVPSPANVRRTGAGTGIDALAASIQAHGLLQSLVVRPKLDADGRKTDRYEVVAGGRRLAALLLLAKRKRIAKGTTVPCRVLDGAGVNGSEASLAENVVRQDMHPADQFEAFAALHGGGTGVEDIAARFGVSGHTVRQRLRLAVVAPALVQAYRDEALTLDHLTAFAVTEDRAAQERVFGQLQDWQRHPDTIRRLLTHALVPATDRKVLLVGLDAYVAAGGISPVDPDGELPGRAADHIAERWLERGQLRKLPYEEYRTTTPVNIVLRETALDMLAVEALVEDIAKGYSVCA